MMQKEYATMGNPLSHFLYSLHPILSIKSKLGARVRAEGCAACPREHRAQT